MWTESNSSHLRNSFIFDGLKSCEDFFDDLDNWHLSNYSIAIAFSICIQHVNIHSESWNNNSLMNVYIIIFSILIVLFLFVFLLYLIVIHHRNGEIINPRSAIESMTYIWATNNFINVGNSERIYINTTWVKICLKQMNITYKPPVLKYTIFFFVVFTRSI